MSAERAIVLANGDLGDAEILRARLRGWNEACVIAADAGSRHAGPLGLQIDVAIGDFDSMSAAERATLSAQGTAIITAPVEKDETDLELALLHAASIDVQRIAVIGALGGRLDMTFANVSLLTLPALEGIHVELWNGAQTAWLISPPGAEIIGQPGDTLSLIPLGGDAAGVITDQLAYPLNGETLAVGPARGLSNILEAETAHITLSAGRLLAVHTPGPA
jgi:thiamine pyrophosphokinase